MKSTLYLTEYKSVRSRSQPKLNETYINQNNKYLDQKSFQSKNKAFNSIKETMLDYIIKEETEYVDLNKCEKLYRDLYYRNKTEMNQILSEQSRKKQYLESLHNQIEKEVILNTQLSKESLVHFYNEEIKNHNSQLIKEKFNFEHYQNIYHQLEEESKNVKERIIECVESNEKNNELFKKYELIKQKAQISLNHQQGVLNEIKEFDKIREDKYKEDLAEKKSKFKDLEYKVFKVKSETVEIEKNIEKLKQLASHSIINIKTIRNKNIKLQSENNQMKREYNFRKIILLRMFKQFEVKSLDEVIYLFNEESRWCNSNFNLYINLNKDISEKNNDYKELDEKFMHLKEQVESLKKGGVANNVSDDLDKSILEDPFVTNLTSRTIETKNVNDFIHKKMFDKYNLIKAYFSLISKYYPKFHKLESSHGMRNINLDTSFNHDIFNNLEKNNDWTNNDIYVLLKMILKFQKKVLFFYSLSIFNLTLEKLENKDNKFEIIYPFDFNKDHIEGQFMKSLINLENKYKILLKSDSEIFSEMRTKESGIKKEITVSKIKTFEKVFENFQRHMKKEGLSTHQNILMKSKLKKHISKLANDLIKEKEKDQENNHSRRNAVAIENKNYEYNRPELENKREITKESYKEEEEKKKETVKEIKEINYFGYNPKVRKDKDQYYQRIEALNKLNTKVFIEKDDNLMNSEINEIYYKYKKRKPYNLKTITNNSLLINNLNQKNSTIKIYDHINTNKLNFIHKEKESFDCSRNKQSVFDFNIRSISQNMNLTNITDRKTLLDTKKVIKSDSNYTETLNTQYYKPLEKEMSNFNTLKTTIISNSNRSNFKENSSLSTIKNNPSVSNLKLKLPKI